MCEGKFILVVILKISMFKSLKKMFEDDEGLATMGCMTLGVGGACTALVGGVSAVCYIIIETCSEICREIL